jgi:hypothetical protein
LLQKLYHEPVSIFFTSQILEKNNSQKKYPKRLKKRKRNLRRDFRELSSSRFAYRLKTFKDLRIRAIDWAQKEFYQKYHETKEKKVSQV